jgi:hypothetical protein
MKYAKFTKEEKKANNKYKLEKALAGAGLYLYENSNNADLTLPKPTESGVRVIGPKQQFQGNSYYMQLVRTGELRLIKELRSPEQDEAIEQEEAMNEETTMNEEQLILDQPDTITEHGKVEHVVNETIPVQPLHEGGDEEKTDVLINEEPEDDGFIIVEN